MARKAIPVSQAALTAMIEDLEAAQPNGVFANRSALWNAVADSDYAKEIGLSSQVAMLRCKAYGYEPKTPVGERGRKPGQGMPANAKPQGGKRSRKKRIPLDVVDTLKRQLPSMHSKIDRAAAGSLKAAVALKCVDCSGGSKKEVALCNIRDCPLWGFRPYQNANEVLSGSN